MPRVSINRKTQHPSIEKNMVLIFKQLLNPVKCGICAVYKKQSRGISKSFLYWYFATMQSFAKLRTTDLSRFFTPNNNYLAIQNCYFA